MNLLLKKYPRFTNEKFWIIAYLYSDRLTAF